MVLLEMVMLISLSMMSLVYRVLLAMEQRLSGFCAECSTRLMLEN